MRFEEDEVLIKSLCFLRRLGVESLLHYDEKRGGQMLFVLCRSFFDYEKSLRETKTDKTAEDKKQEHADEGKEEDRSESTNIVLFLPVSAGGTKERRKEIEPEKYESKFTDADRNSIYLKIHEARCISFYQKFIPNRIYDKSEARRRSSGST